MERVQYNNQQQQQQQFNEQMSQQQQQQQLTTPQRLKQQQQHQPSNNNDMSAMDNQNIRQQQINDYRVRNSFGLVANASPYHATQPSANNQRPEVQSDITQQINSAIIGSSEAEFQNDFIQVSFQFNSIQSVIYLFLFKLLKY